MDLAQMREHYSEVGLGEDDVVDDPIVQFRRWFDEWLATKPYDVNAVILATTDVDGWPSARAVLLKGLDERGFVFHTNRRSAKGIDLDRSHRATLCFLWHPLERQVRVVGSVEHLPDDESDAYFASRPAGRTDRSLGFTAVRADRRPVRTGAAHRRGRGPLRRGEHRAPATPLGRLPGPASHRGVLAGTPQPSARSAALPPARRSGHRDRPVFELGDRASRSLNR